MRAAPVVSVILPTHGRAPHLGEQLAALAAQDLAEPWELVVVADRLDPAPWQLAATWTAPCAELRLVTSPRPGCPAARNVGIAAARADRLVSCDDDDVVAPDWLRTMHAALADHELVAGHLHPLGEPPAHEPALPCSPAGFLPHAITANCGFHRAVVDRIGGFDETLPRFSDTELSWRAQLAGVTLTHEPRAVVAKRARPTLRASFAQTWSWGRAEATLYPRFREHGMPRDPWTTAVRDAAHQLVAAVRASTPGARRLAVRRLGWRLGRWAGSLRTRILYP